MTTARSATPATSMHHADAEGGGGITDLRGRRDVRGQEQHG